MTANNLALRSSQNWRNGEENWDSHDRRQPSVPRTINIQQGEEGGMNMPWRLFEERVRTGPFGLTRFPSQPHSPSQILIIEATINGERVNPRLLQFIHESPPRIRRDWQLGFLSEPESPALTDAEFNSAMKKVRKQTYDPQPKRKPWKRGLFSNRNNNRSIHELEINDEKNEEDKQCVICLESFVPKEQVLVTPCNHMFHKKCLVPWVKSHGKCPFCRFKLVEKEERAQAPNYRNYNNNNGGDMYEDDLALEFITLVRAMEEALMWMHLN